MANYIEEEQGGKGALAIVIVIIVLLLIGGIYAVNSQKSGSDNVASSTDQVASPEGALSLSTGLSDIDQDMKNLEANTSQADLDQLEKEIKGL
ncbi:MAG: hypothetical protein NTY66_01605 [Candidatus Vogelbacteria bacterium]|nr:hypothetical protein [Candidatus Vogelbacteria bacterium]